MAKGSEPKCVTDYFLLEASKKTNGGSFTRSQLYFLQADLFGAGIDTSLNTIMWSLLYLSSEEGKLLQSQIQDEMDQECQSSSVSLSHKLPLLRATILEVQRLRPVTPLGVPHGTTQAVKYGQWTLPSGTMVIPLHWAINRDPELWESPEKFLPNRFLDNEGNLQENGKLYPFQVM